MNAMPTTHYDRGASGVAASSRTSAMIEIEGQSRGSAQPGERIEVKRYSDSEIWDRLHAMCQISDRQHWAAERAARMFVAAGLHPRLSADYGGRQDRSHDDSEAATALDRYRAMARQQKPPMMEKIEATLLGAHPGVRWLATLQSALDDLARWFEVSEGARFTDGCEIDR